MMSGVPLPSRILPYPARVERLPNGLKIVLVPMSSHGLVAYWTIVRTGSRDEFEPGRTGFAHFFEHMMFRGTERFPQEEYNRIVTEMGADANAYTTDDLTAYHLSITAEDLETVARIESDRFRNLSYSQEAFRTEAGAVYGEYRKSRTDPFFAVYEAVHEAAFERHSYGHTTMGYLKDIQAMPGLYDYSRTFFSRYYRPENVLLLVAGDIDAAATRELLERHYGGWEPGYRPPEVEAEPEQRAERRVDVPYEGRSLPIVWMAYKAGRFDPDDRGWAAALLLGELAYGETSEVFRRLVLEEQVAEFVQADLGWNRDPGLLSLIARVKQPERVGYVMDEIDRVAAHHRESPPDPRRLADLKSRIRYHFLMNLDTPDRVAGALSRILALTGEIDSLDRLHATIASVEPEDIRRAARALLEPRRRTVALLRGEG
jgi:zinc protease